MIFLLLASLLSPPAFALESKDLKKLFCPFQPQLASKRFAKEFLEHGSLEEVRKWLLEQRQQFGPCRDLRTVEPPAYELVYEEAIVPMEILPAENGRVKSVFFGMPRLKNDSIERVSSQLKSVPYRMSLYSGTESGKELFSHHPDDSLSISRSNQIFILRGAQAAIADRKLKASELIPLEEKSFVPVFGIIHFWKPGSLISIDTLLNLMVAEKDLTASDLLLSRLDPSSLARFAKSHIPFLSFREYFLLADLPREQLVDATQSIPKLLPALKGRPTPPEASLDRVDLVSQLGWFASTRELCQSAFAVKEELIARNSRINAEYKSIQPRDVEKFAIVQSRDSGISQMTAVFTIKGQKEWRCLSVTGNHSGEVEEGFFASIVARVTNLLVEKKNP